MARYQARRAALWAALLCFPLPLTVDRASAPTNGGTKLSKQRAAQVLQDLPLLFEPNRGQTDSQVRFLARAAGMTSFLTGSEHVMVLSRRKGGPEAAKQDRLAASRPSCA